MSSIIVLSRATEIKRDSKGRVYAWRMSDKGKQSFESLASFKRHIKTIKNLDSYVAFSGSASMLSTANALIAQEMAKR